MDENGRQPVQMEVDEDTYPLDNITDFNTHLKLKPLEKAVEQNTAKVEVSTLMLPSEARSSKKTWKRCQGALFLPALRERLDFGVSSENSKNQTQNGIQLI